MASGGRSGVGLRPDAAKTLTSLARRKRCSKGGLLSVLIEIVNGQHEDVGIIDLDWEKVRKMCPNKSNRGKRTWDAVMTAVRELAKDFDTAEEISQHSRFTLAQCRRALEELRSE